MSGSRLKSWFGDFRNEIQWTVVVVVLAVLGVVALWPREPAPVGPGSSDSVRPGAGAPADPAVRRAAQLSPCPSAPEPFAGGAELAGATGTCLADGTPASLAAAVTGHPAVINVWASWCAPCRTELPVLQEYSRQPGAVPVVGVQVNSDEADGLALLKDLGVHFPSLHDDSNRISAALKLPPALPASYVVTVTGEVRRIPPMVFGAPEEVRTAVDQTLGAGR